MDNNANSNNGSEAHLAHLRAALLYEAMQNSNRNGNSSGTNSRSNQNAAAATLDSLNAIFGNNSNAPSNNSNQNHALASLLAQQNSHNANASNQLRNQEAQFEREQAHNHASAQIHAQGASGNSNAGNSPFPNFPPIPPSIAAFANLPMPRVNQPLPPVNILEGDLVIFDHIAKRARATAEHIEASLFTIRTAMDQWRHIAPQGQAQAQVPPPVQQLSPANSQPIHARQQNSLAASSIPYNMETDNRDVARQPPYGMDDESRLRFQAMINATNPPHHPAVNGLGSGLGPMLEKLSQAESPSRRGQGGFAPVVTGNRNEHFDDEAHMIANSMIHRFTEARPGANDPDDDRKQQAKPQGAVATAPVEESYPDAADMDEETGPSELMQYHKSHHSESSPTDAMIQSDLASRAAAAKRPLGRPPAISSPNTIWVERSPEEDYVLSPLVKRDEKAKNRNSVEFVTWTQALSDCDWVTTNDVGVSLDSVLISLAQFKVCALTQDDRIGRYMQQEIGYIGLCCKHCFGQPGYGRYFPSTLPSFVSSFPGTATKHIGEDCPGCPQHIKDLVRELESLNQKSVLRRPDHSGSKGLMQSVWNSLRETKLDSAAASDDAKISKALQIPVAENGQGITWGALLGGSELVLIQDRHLVPDTLYAAFAQFEKCHADEGDCTRAGRHKSPKSAFVGMCCRYCRGAGFTAGSRIFPVNTLGLGLTDNCNKMVKHVTSLCPKCPASLRAAFTELMANEKKGARRYGSRKIFFRRVWLRLHGTEPDAALEGLKSPGGAAGEEDDSDNTEVEDDDDILPLEKLVEHSRLVTMNERGMVSDAHFVAFAQLKPCHLEESDKAGWYKDREVGFPGVCCMHCGGRPSSGRYFPRSGDNFLRSSKHSIIRHITENCSNCPKEVRQSLVKLQQRDSARSSWKIVDDSVLGAGKLFHERIWIRLYEILQVPPGLYEVLDRSNGSNAQNVALMDNQDGNSSPYLEGNKRDRTPNSGNAKTSRRKTNAEPASRYKREV